MNVVVFVVDALRADHLPAYGYERDTAPFVSEFADEAIQYTGTFTPTTWTRSAAASLLTGTYPSVHGVMTLDDPFTTDLQRLPAILQKEGFATHAVSAIGNISTELGFGRGFDQFTNLYKDSSLSETRATSDSDSELLKHEDGTVVFPHGEDVIERFEADVLEPGTEPFFSLLWTIDTHDPYDPPDGYRDFVDPDYTGEIDGSRESLRTASTDADFQRLINLYDSEIKYVDAVFEQLVETLKEHGVFEETLVVFTADHGEAFGDHGRNVGHAHVHYEELLHVPLVVRYPGDRPEWEGDDDLVSLVDIMPTLLSYLDIEHQDRRSVPSGQSVLDGGRSEVFSATYYSNAQNDYHSLRERDWKYITVESAGFDLSSYLDLVTSPGFMKDVLKNPLYFFRRRFRSEDAYLFHLVNDPEEQHNLVTERSGERQRLAERLQDWRDEVEAAQPDGDTGEASLEAETEEQLKAMGYLDG